MMGTNVQRQLTLFAISVLAKASTSIELQGKHKLLNASAQTKLIL